MNARRRWGWRTDAGSCCRTIARWRGRSTAWSRSTFEKTAAARFRWYELLYRVPDPFHHRKSFDVKLRLQNIARADTVVRVFPSPWIDGPGGVRAEGERWTEGQSYWRSILVVLPTLGVLIFLFFVGPAFFNARRALFRRARPRGRAGDKKVDTV